MVLQIRVKSESIHPVIANKQLSDYRTEEQLVKLALESAESKKISE